MSKEIRASAPTGLTSTTPLYALVYERSTGKIWNPAAGPAAFVALGSAIQSYAIPLTESALPGEYTADFPAGIAAGLYAYEVRKCLGGSPVSAHAAATDRVIYEDEVPWSGSVVALGGTVGTAAAHPAYVLAYTGETVFIAADRQPLAWSVTRKDGTVPDVPVSATIRVWDSAGVLVDTLPATPDPAPAAGSIVLAALWAVRAIGAYLVQITIQVPVDGQIRSDRKIVEVR